MKKHISNPMKLWFAFTLTAAFLFSQAVVSQSIVVEPAVNEALVLRLGEYKGTLQWQVSPDGEEWSDVPNATADTLDVRASYNLYYRGSISVPGCPEYYTGKVHVKPRIKETVIFTQPDVGVGDIEGRIFVAETRPLAKWFMISWQRSPFIEGGRPFVPVDWDPGEKTGLSIPGNRALNQRGYRNEAGTTVGQMFGNTVGAYLNSADLSGDGLDENGYPLPGGDDYKHGFFPEYHFYPQRLSANSTPIYLWREENSSVEISLEMQIPTAECAEKNGSIAYANPLLLLVDPTTNLKISWGPMLFSKRSQGDYTQPLQSIRLDGPSNSWMVRDRLVSGAFYMELAPGSAQHQTAPWRGFKLFAWTVTRAHVEKALKVMHEQEPHLQMSVDPGDYYLSQFHLNAETNYRTAPTELGWSMRNLRIVQKYPILTD